MFATSPPRKTQPTDLPISIEHRKHVVDEINMAHLPMQRSIAKERLQDQRVEAQGQGCNLLFALLDLLHTHLSIHLLLLRPNQEVLRGQCPDLDFIASCQLLGKCQSSSIFWRDKTV